MPFRETKLDNGFTDRVRPNFEQPQPEAPNFFDNFATAAQLLNPITTASTITRNLPLAQAAFNMDNAVVNGWRALSRPQFEADPTFDVKGALERDGLWQGYRDNFLGVRSKAEYDYIANKITQENRDRNLLAQAGPAGLVMSGLAGIADPTSLMPLIGEGKGVFAVLKSIFLGGAAALIDEIPLQANQETRTLEDTAFSVAGGSVLGGLMGGAAVLLRRGAGESVASALGGLANRIDVSGGDKAISDSVRIQAILDSEKGTSGPASGMIRYYHGTAFEDASTFHGKTFLTPQEDYARNYRGGPNNVLYTDFTKDEAIARGLWDEVNNYPINGAIDDGRTVLQPLRKADKARTAQLEEDLRLAREREATDLTVDEHLVASSKPAAVGADVIERDAGGLKNMLGIGERLTRIAGPVTANLGQRVSATIRQMTAELSTAGLRLEKNVILDSKGNIIGSIPSNQGGTVESLIQMRRGEVLSTLNKSYENYADYVFGPGESTAPFRNQRAALAGQVQRRAKIGPQAKMNRREFFEAVGDAMLHEDQHAIPQVANTAREHRALYDRLFEEAKSVGLISKDVQLLGDTSFLNRIYNNEAISRNPNRFLDLLTDHMNSELQKDFAQVHSGYVQAQARDSQRVADMTMPLADAKALQKQYQEELKALDAKENLDEGPIEDLISLYRSEAVARAKQINKLDRDIAAGKYANAQERAALLNERARLSTERTDFRDQVSSLQEVGGPDLEARAVRRAELKRRLRNLNRNQYFVQEKYRKKFDSIEALEEQSIDTMNRAIRIGHNALQEIDHISDKSQQSIERASKALDGVVDQWVNLGNRIEALKAKPENTDLSLENPDLEVAKLLDLQGKQDVTLQRLLDAQENLRSIQNIDRTENGVADARGAVQEALDATVEKLTELNIRRAKRMAKLEKDAEKFDQKAWDARIKEVQDRMQSRTIATHDRLHAMGADDADLVNGTANFKQHAREIAEAAMEKIQGTNMRLAGFDAMQSERGTELARTLSIPSDKLTPYGFLVKDAEHLIHAYGNTLIPDIEIVRRLGLFAPDGNLNPMFKAINEEEHRVVDLVQKDFEAKAAKAGKPVNEVELGKLLKGVGDEYNRGRDNLRAIIMRLRHQWGVPSKPNGFVARGVNVVLGLQALRLLGGVTISSISDVARPIMRYGLQRTMMNGWVPMINNWKGIRMSMQEAQRAFVAVETMTADRAHQMADLLQNAQRRSMGEAALEWGVSKIGVVAGFSPWTDVMKTLSFMVQTSKVLDSLELALRGKGSSAARKEAVEYLASLGWDNALQEKIWKQIEAGGGQKIKGTWVPQTDSWTDQDAVRAFRAAANREAAATIITPGVEIPKFMNENSFFRVMMNLKSFGMASTSKTVMAALQQRDMAVLNGVMISLALGALSKYLGAQIAGGDALDRYMALTPQQHVNEAIDQSGLLGAIGYGAQLLSDMTAGPSTGDQPQQKFLKTVRDLVGAHELGDPASQIVGDVAGPTAQLATLLTQAEASGKWTPSEIHRIRQLLPLQNVFYLRKLFDAVENAVGGNRQ